MLANSFWRMVRGDGSVIIPAMVLLWDGNIGIHNHVNERRWLIQHQELLFQDREGFTVATFGMAGSGSQELRRLAGQYRRNGEAVVLERIAQPAMEDWPSDPWANRRAPFIEHSPTPQRANLVVLCANERSLHANWQRVSDDDERNWDLCITFYGTDCTVAARPFEYLAHQPGQPKWRALYNLFYPESPLWNYQFIWLPDDDLMTSWQDVNQLFAICRRYSLLLAQPSIDPKSNVNHAITGTHLDYALRFTNFVEIMCPVFGRDALRVATGTFRDTISGYGLDNLWPQLLGGVPGRIAIIDALSVEHTRPLGRNYDGSAAVREGRAMQQLYNGFSGVDMLGGIARAAGNFL